MAGKIKKIIDEIYEQKGGGNKVVVSSLRTKLILSGVNPDKYDLNSPDDEAILQKLKLFANTLSIKA